jgi:hypothetical protein
MQRMQPISARRLLSDRRTACARLESPRSMQRKFGNTLIVPSCFADSCPSLGQGEIDLARRAMWSTTSIRFAESRARRRGPRSCAGAECSPLRENEIGICEMKYGGVVHSRFAEEEL